MQPRADQSITRPLWCVALVLLAGLAGSTARADAIYSITDLGTLPGQTSSVATAINNQGQVVGISYNSSDGYFVQTLSGSAEPPRFQQTQDGAQSFLYSAGNLTQISPTGGLAMSINDSGQVVGGQYTSINASGQYVGGPGAGVQEGNYGNNPPANQLVSGGTTTTLLMLPYAINSAGQIAGDIIANSQGSSAFHPAVYQNAQITDLFPKIASGQSFDSRAIAINQNGDTLIAVQPFGGTQQSYLYNATTGVATNLTTLPGGLGMIAAALNDKDQAVGNGLLYSNGSIQTLLSLLPANSGWSNLNATGINDAGQIVGQGSNNGQEQAFLMTPIAEEVPEPGALEIWGSAAAATGLFVAARRRRATFINDLTPG